MDNQLIQ
jgi:predicted ribosomally synthesized peptide with nif11-like leader